MGKGIGRTFRNMKDKFTKKIQNEKYSINYDKFDIEMFEKLVKDNDELQKILYEGADEYAPFKELLQDTFDSLFKYHPDLRKDFEMKSSHVLNQKIMDQVLEAPKYKELRALTRNDEVNSTVGTEILSFELKELLKQMKEEMEALKAMQEAADAQQKAQDDADAKAKANGDGGEDGDEEGEPGSGNNKISLEEAKKKLEAANKEYEEKKAEFDEKTSSKKFQQDVHRAVSKSQNSTQEVEDFIQNWGLGKKIY